MTTSRHRRPTLPATQPSRDVSRSAPVRLRPARTTRAGPRSSPRSIPKNLIDHRVYDHASMPATIEQLLGLDPLTNRDRHANSLHPLDPAHRRRAPTRPLRATNTGEQARRHGGAVATSPAQASAPNRSIDENQVACVRLRRLHAGHRSVRPQPAPRDPRPRHRDPDAPAGGSNTCATSPPESPPPARLSPLGGPIAPQASAVTGNVCLLSAGGVVRDHESPCCPLAARKRSWRRACGCGRSATRRATGRCGSSDELSTIDSVRPARRT